MLLTSYLAFQVDEKLLYDTFSAFGVILQVPKIMRDTDTGGSKGFAFVNFASFEASDAAMEAMNGQFLCNRYILHHLSVLMIITELSQYPMRSRKTLRENVTERLLRECWLPRIHCSRKTDLIR